MLEELAFKLVSMVVLVAGLLFSAKQYTKKSSQLEVAKDDLKEANKANNDAAVSNEIDSSVDKMSESELDAGLRVSMQRSDDN